MTRIAAVLGFPVAHSRSPAMINAAFVASGIDARMEAISVAPDRLAEEVARLREIPMLGASVTVPHKFAVAKLCDELAGAASETGAVNCLVLDGKLVGHNTDVFGFQDALADSGFDMRGKHAVVLGGGGSARAIDYALQTGGATVDIAARRPDAVAWTHAYAWEQLPARLSRADLVVDCTPTGLDPATDAAFVEELPLHALPSHAMVATLVYHRRTQLLDAAAAHGHRTMDGRLMLIYQAAHAFTLWTGKAAPIDIMTRAFDDAMKTT